MNFSPQRKNIIALLVTLAVISVAFNGCGDAQGVSALNACLTEFSELVENYQSSVGADNSKQPEWDAKVAAISEKWTNIRNEFGSDITPQHMDKMVNQYENLMATLIKFKKTLGS